MNQIELLKEAVKNIREAQMMIESDESLYRRLNEMMYPIESYIDEVENA